MLREFSRRCKLPNTVFKFDENGITVSFVNNVWVRVEIPILEILGCGLASASEKKTLKKKSNIKLEKSVLNENSNTKKEKKPANSTNQSKKPTAEKHSI